MGETHGRVCPGLVHPAAWLSPWHRGDSQGTNGQLIKCNACDGVEFGFFFLRIFFFNEDHFLKSSSNLLQYCFCFMFWFFGHKARGIFTP